MLYSQIFQYLLKREEVAELTIEDPSEAFEDLRDKEDLKLLMKHQVFDQDLDQLVPVNREWYQATKDKWKLADVSHSLITSFEDIAQSFCMGLYISHLCFGISLEAICQIA